MPRDGSGVYSQPYPDVVPDTTIESLVYNGFVADVVIDLNQPRPVGAGGTGGENAAEALANLGGETSTQTVTNFDSHVWVPGSFRATASATAPPVAGHAFTGWVYSLDPVATPPTNQNLVVEARDANDTTVPGTLYTREKKAGVWGPWVAAVADLEDDLTELVEGRIVVSPTPPPDPLHSTLWWESDSGQLFIRYKDPDNTEQWVSAVRPGPTGVEGPPGADGAVGPAGPAGPVGPMGDYGRTRYSVAGLSVLDVEVPVDAIGMRFNGMVFGTFDTVFLCGSVAAGVFKNTMGDYIVSGVIHYTFSNPTTVGGAHYVANPGMVLTSAHTNAAVPAAFSGYMSVGRSASGLYLCTCECAGSGHHSTLGSVHSFYSSSMVPAAAGSATRLLAVRFSASVGAWEADSFITVEWL